MATYQGFDNPKTGEAGTAITKCRYVVRASDGQMDHVGTSGGEADGVSLFDQATVGGQFAYAPIAGADLKVEAGAAISTDGAKVMSDTSGRAITYVEAAGNLCLGHIKGTAGAAGDIVTIDSQRIKTGPGT